MVQLYTAVQKCCFQHLYQSDLVGEKTIIQNAIEYNTLVHIKLFIIIYKDSVYIHNMLATMHYTNHVHFTTSPLDFQLDLHSC